jgi:hypothetical protein
MNTAHFAGFKIAVSDLSTTRAVLVDAGVETRDTVSALQVGLAGIAVEFTEVT